MRWRTQTKPLSQGNGGGAGGGRRSSHAEVRYICLPTWQLSSWTRESSISAGWSINREDGVLGIYSKNSVIHQVQWMIITLKTPTAPFPPSGIRGVSRWPPPTKESAQENVNFHTYIHILGTVSQHWGSKTISSVEGSMMRLRGHSTITS